MILVRLLAALGLAVPVPSPAHAPPELVARLVALHRPALGACLERQRRADPDFRGGHLEVRVLVDLAGRVADSFVVRSSAPEGLGECVRRTITSWVFPPTSEDYEAEIPLWLQPN